ncbi:MAG: carboxypeptidase regulatory-like domain-containing protein [Acidimicrobiia bacterium]|nr:carboxypeptidase regulatory-like domain-containing protein [Acidimicrobiia bacterium]
MVRLLAVMLAGTWSLLGAERAMAASQADLVAVEFRLGGGKPVERAAVFDGGGDLSKPAIVVRPGQAAAVSIAFVPGREVVVQFEVGDGTYLLDGPFRWPDRSEVHDVGPVLRRTVAGVLPGPGKPALEPPLWIDAQGRANAGAWPQCGASARMWACVGVPFSESGLAVFAADHPAAFAMVRAGGEPVVKTAAWATVVVAAGNDPDALEVELWRPVAPGSNPDGLRVRPERASGCDSAGLSPGSVLVWCTRDDDVDVLVSAAGRARARATVESATAWLLSPLTMELLPDVPVQGRVETSSRRPAAGALVEISELLEVAGPDGEPREVRRSLMEVVADDRGRFEARGLGAGAYEALAAHPTFGRVRSRFQASQGEVVLVLAAARRLTGQVVRQGRAVVEAVVEVVPEPGMHLRVSDPYDAIAPGTATDDEGRFEVALPASGANELRIHAGGVVARWPVPPGQAAVTDLGVLELPGRVAVSVEYRGNEGCRLLAVGPLGRTGFSTVEATVTSPGARRFDLPEPGQWFLTAACAGVERTVEPPMIDVPADRMDWSTIAVVR